MKRLEIDYSLKSMDVLVSLARYNFVNKIIQDKNLKVLDYGCGSGYGTKVLLEKFPNVTSHDTYFDDYRPAGITVETDIEKIKKQQYDLVTCFEVIEHMDEAAQNVLMDNLAGLLNKDGVLFISTVRKMVPPPTQNRKDYHTREVTFEELYAFCSKHFKTILTFGQIDQIISTFNNDNHYHFVFVCTNKK